MEMRCPSPRILELSARLVEEETNAAVTGQADHPGVSRVCDKLRPHLATLMGTVGFQALLWRALVVAGAGDERLRILKVNPQGELEGWDGEDSGQVASGTLLIAHLLTLLAAFIGKNLTFRIVCEAWPELTIDHLDLSKDEEHDT